jgi:predicted ABC-type ATPase
MKSKRSESTKPTAYIIAGSNGSGKTTFAMRFLPQIAGCRNFINVDLIAKGLSPFNVEAVEVQAGRLFLERIHEQIERRVDFAFESTLSGLGYIGLFRELREKGFQIHLYFLWIPNILLALKRIADRVRLGGHNVLPDVVRRRYGKGLKNLFNMYMSMTDYCAIFDNSSTNPELVFERIGKRENILFPNLFREIQKQAETIK